MEEYGFDAPRATLLQQQGRLADAAESHLKDGDVLEAIRLFIEDREHASSLSRAVQCFLQYLWRRMSYGVTREGAHGAQIDELTFQAITDYGRQLLTLCRDADDLGEVRSDGDYGC